MPLFLFVICCCSNFFVVAWFLFEGGRIGLAGGSIRVAGGRIGVAGGSIGLAGVRIRVEGGRIGVAVGRIGLAGARIRVAGGRIGNTDDVIFLSPTLSKGEGVSALSFSIMQLADFWFGSERVSYNFGFFIWMPFTWANSGLVEPKRALTYIFMSLAVW